MRPGMNAVRCLDIAVVLHDGEYGQGLQLDYGAPALAVVPTNIELEVPGPLAAVILACNDAFIRMAFEKELSSEILTVGGHICPSNDRCREPIREDRRAIRRPCKGNGNGRDLLSGCRWSSYFYDSEIDRRIFDGKANHREFVCVWAVAGNSKSVKGISCVPLLAQPVEYMMRGYEIPVGDDAPGGPCEP
jgi:hypothetical protein